MGQAIGKLFGGLTNTSLSDPSGQSQQFSGPNAGDQAAQAATIPTIPTMQGRQPVDQAPQQKISSPSFIQAMHTGPGGTPNATSPMLTTKGKILTALLSGAAGGAAAAGQRTVGGGFEAGRQLPFIQAMQGQEAQQGQLKTNYLPQQLQTGLDEQQAKAQLMKTQAAMAGQMITITDPVSGTPMQIPMSMAAKVFPGVFGAEGRVKAAEVGAGSRIGAAQIGANARVKVGQMNLGPMANVPEDVQQELGLPAQLPLKQTSSAIGAVNKPLAVVRGANDSYTLNKHSGAKTAVGVGNPQIAAINARPLQVADPNNPGNTVYETAGQALQQGAAGPQSASVQVPKGIMKSNIPSKAGDLKVAMNTAINHADLLRTAVRALHNGDNQTLNGIKNAFKNEFGYSGPITAQAIADAYGGEITNIVAKGHMTDAEIAKTGKTINPMKQNFATMDSVLGAYQALAKSKLDNLNKQQQAVLSQSQVKGKGGAATQTADPLGIR